MSKKIKSVIISTAFAAVVAASAAFSGCSVKSDHPTAEITVNFNNAEYVIEYKLYRNMYPRTVEHFIELADEGFYDNMIIHDYTAGGDWFSGSYKYEEAEYKPDDFKSYLPTFSKEADYYSLYRDGKLTPTVFVEGSISEAGDKDAIALPTLIGEFSSNQHNIENGSLTALSGCLKMYYYDKGDDKKVVSMLNSFDQVLVGDYNKNCATSVFSMQVGSSTYTADKYCVFGKVKDDSSKNILNDLQDDIKEYIDDELSGQQSKFYTSVDTDVDLLDETVSGGKEVTFKVPNTPIVITSVKITKY